MTLPQFAIFVKDFRVLMTLCVVKGDYIKKRSSDLLDLLERTHYTDTSITISKASFCSLAIHYHIFLKHFFPLLLIDFASRFIEYFPLDG